MALQKVKIENFKIFESFELEFNKGLNILVGDNEVGKSTILEAIHLTLTGMINGKYLSTELTQYLFNNVVVEKYLKSIQVNTPLPPPYIKIELYFDACDEIALFMGGINSDRNNNAYGLKCIISLESTTEYEELIKIGNIKTLPLEYYDAKWYTFADKLLPSTKSIPIKSAMVDSTLARYKNSSDIYISRIVRQSLDPSDTVKIAQAHRNMIEVFVSDTSVQEINKKISDNAQLAEKEISFFSVQVG